MRVTRARRALVSAVLVTAAALTGVSCTASSAGRPAEPTATPPAAAASLAALRAAQRATDGAASARVRSTTVMGGQLSLRADGALRWRDRLTGTLTITYTGGATAEQMRALGVTSMQARYLPDAYYARLGDAFARRAGGRHWIRYAYDDLDALDGAAGADFAEQVRNTTPGQSVKLLLESDDVRRTGTETVAGRRTTHWTGTVEVADVSDPELRGQLTRAGMTGGTVDIWVDQRNLLVKKVEKGRTTSGGYTQTAYYSDYGTPVAVTAPPAADTADFTELAPQS
ncbi:hypothetical protein ACIP3D_20765 [Streptomyces longwoodensis]|uniref:hypothetical protein n=1 Tax=Streptomyces longwoodensis TaxID=68231 RepID=UPI00382ECE00